MLLEDTALSVHRPGVLPGGFSTISSRAPNSVYEQRQMAAHSCSVFLGQRRSPSPSGLLVMQRCARLVEQTAESALSRVGRIEDETRCIRKLVEATNVEARSVRNEVEAKVATLAVQTVVSMSQMVEVVQGRVSELVAYSDAQLSRIIVEVMQ